MTNLSHRHICSYEMAVRGKQSIQLLNAQLSTLLSNNKMPFSTSLRNFGDKFLCLLVIRVEIENSDFGPNYMLLVCLFTVVQHENI